MQQVGSLSVFLFLIICSLLWIVQEPMALDLDSYGIIEG